LNYNATGGSNSSGPAQPRGFQPQASAAEDLLGDGDPEISKRLTNETTELANLSNQVGNLSKQMQDVQGQRATTNTELTHQQSQKREFELRLNQLRSLYEQEVKDVKILEERLAASRNEIKKLQTDIAMIEGTYLDLQNQHRQAATALQADQEENANLKERMRIVNAEIAQLKPALEKLRSDARQQKGLVAINKKQLATNEAEREKLKAEAEELNKSIEDDKKELAAAAKVQSPAQITSPAQAASPALSTMSATNPFFRRHGSTSELPTSPFAQSPVASQSNDRSFENVFGPSFSAAPAEHDAAPPTTFRQDSEVRSPSGALASALPTRSGTGSAGGFPSPSSTSRELPQAIEPPPPPPVSRQITSSFLPFPSEHEESVSSSRKVSAPNSRFGEGSTGADTPTNYIGSTPTGSSAAGGLAENTRAVSPGLDRKSNASPAAIEVSKDSIPGAFPGDLNSGIVATPTGGSTLSEQAAADPFGAGKEPVRSATAKDDFDAAFAGFSAPPKTQERSLTGNSSNEGSVAAVSAGFHKEFPPIAELEHDDESESASEGGGFEDDFAPASPGHARNTSSSQIPTLSSDSTTSASGFLVPRPGMTQNSSALSMGTNPPTPGAQEPPPAYNKVVSPSDAAHSDLQQLSGLLPKREDPTSPSNINATEHTSSSNATAQTSFGDPTVSTKPAPPARVPFDEDFDDFDDLEDAKEGDPDDDFANISVHDRSVIDDFNPMFDSPPAPPKAQHSATGSSGFGGESAFGEFTSSPRQITQSVMPTNSNTVNDSHDWDAIFAGLDGPAPSTTAPAISTSAETKPGDGTSASPAPIERPQIGRALTEAGEHDDPILKNLTGMGYPRADALTALEKYDYNLERVGCP
jgi:epidermal growth factor receptor substrate 15